MASIYPICITRAGLALITAAEMNGVRVNLTHIAVGDGNGLPTDPKETQQALVREIYRQQINSLAISKSDPTIIMAEMVIPAEVGGFAIRELGIFDQAGTLFAVGRFPDTYKPAAAQGSTSEMIIRCAVKTGNASVIDLVIDASIVIATRDWVLAHANTAKILPGGLTGQMLAKTSNADGHVEWKSLGDTLNIAVDVIEETQFAAAEQTVFTLSVCSTDGVAVYVNGSRLHRNHDYIILNQTQVQVQSPIQAGAKLLFAQNEPNEPLDLHRLVIGCSYFLGQV